MEDLNKLYRTKHTILLQVVRDILVENKLTTHEQFNKKYIEKVDMHEMPEEDKTALKEGI
ncbi:hypothetical protein [Heyndrickxia oleronia]|uniref:hypothetical protein n=1 Tax=Heyndrickxia oleronia TaxID=38875 RepID=UPI001B12A31A|nr:hypothetical protein [Heyndrickxia oleronia]GIN38388.1 hypothetical protein J19TS1_13370 [Heyndrickxia oleronia]